MPGYRQDRLFAPLGWACYFTGAGTPAEASARGLGRLSCLSPLQQLCFQQGEPPARLSSWEDRTPAPLSKYQAPACGRAGLCEDQIRKGPPLCRGWAPRRRRTWQGLDNLGHRPWGLGGPGCQCQHQEPLQVMAFPPQGTQRFCPCQEEGNEEGEQDRDKVNEEKPGRRRQRNYGPKTNTREKRLPRVLPA